MKIKKLTNCEETAKQLGREAGKVVAENFNVSIRIEKFQDIIEQTIKEYGYKGKNFKSIYLPVIISMALEKCEKVWGEKYNSLLEEAKKNKPEVNKLFDELKSGSNRLKELLSREGFDNAFERKFMKGTLVKVKRTKGDKTFLSFYHI